MNEELPWRCSRCGAYAAPDRRKTVLDPRFATGTCPSCHEERMLVHAETVEEATAGWHQLQEEAEKRQAAIQARDGVKK